MAKLALFSNRKFLRLVGMLRMDSELHVESHLVSLWRATWHNGNAIIGDLQDIEALAGWTKMSERVKYPSGAFAAALVLTGFVDTIVEGELYAVHDWYEHAEQWVKQRISRRAKEDPTVCEETYFLGLDAWTRRAAKHGLRLEGRSTSEEIDDPDMPSDAVGDTNSQRGHQNARHLDEWSPKGSPQPRFGYLSSLAEPSRAEPSPGSISPPSSPPSLFSPIPRPPKPAAPEELAVIPNETALMTVIGRVTDAVVHLIGTGDEEAADLLEGQALECRSLADWTALADIATDALRRSANLSPSAANA